MQKALTIHNPLQVTAEGFIETVYDTATTDDYAAIALLLFSILRVNGRSSNYSESADAIEMQKAATKIAAIALGDEFVEASITGTDDDIAVFINKLLDNQNYVIAGGPKIYAVGFEACGVLSDEWGRIISVEHLAQIWSDDIEVAEDRGWSDEALLEISSLGVGDYLDSYSDHCHSLFRVA